MGHASAIRVNQPPDARGWHTAAESSSGQDAAYLRIGTGPGCLLHSVGLMVCMFRGRITLQLI
jgi:hypothetical protein